MSAGFGKQHYKKVFTAFITRFPTIYGSLLGMYALIAFLFSALRPLRHRLQRIREFFDIVILPMPEVSISWAIALGLLAAAVLARKRMAWWVSVILLIFLNLENALFFAISLYEPVYETRLATIELNIGFVVKPVMLIGLLATRAAFPARTRHAAMRKATAVYLLGEGIVALAGWGLVELFPHTLAREDRLKWVINKAYTFSLADGKLIEGHPGWIASFVVTLASAIIFLLSVWTMFSSQRDNNALTAEDETAIRAMIARWGEDDSLAYFATRRDKSVIYSPDGRAAITYRVEMGVCIASGDPIGNPAAWDQAVETWLHQATMYGWTPAVMGASERGAHCYLNHGLQTLRLGDEAIIYTDNFSLSRPEYKAVRQAVARARRGGVTVRIRRHGELTAEEMASVQRDADTWRDTNDERGFSMALSRLGDPADSNNLLVEAIQDSQHSPTGIARRVGELSFSPWGRTGMSLDLMRRAPDSPNGTVEAMVSELCHAGTDVGVTRISLNFAMFRQVFATAHELGTGPVMRLWRSLLVFLSRWWQMEALYRSNEKYNPTWAPRYICFKDNHSIARVGLVSGIVEGFIPAFLSRRRPPRTPIGSVKSDGAVNALALAPQLLEEAHAGRAIQHRRPEQVTVRLEKAQRLRDEGIDPWPTALRPTHMCGQITDLNDGDNASISGRILARRDFGGVMFLKLQDWSGDIQIIIEKERCHNYPKWRKELDLADIIRVDGHRGVSRKGEPSLLADAIRLEAKSLHPLPNKTNGLTDPEARVRSRHIDLTVNEESRRALKARSAVLHSMRNDLHTGGYVEAETPILQPIHGGANARPFTTHINAYNMGLYLRIAPELFLKRLMCGGVNRVFEVGREFRNEGVDATHNPEFTSLEAYDAHGDYETMRELTHTLIVNAATAVHGKPVVTAPDGSLVDISGEWPVKSVMDAITEGARADGLWEGPTITVTTPRSELNVLMERAGMPCRPDADLGTIIEELYDEFVESRTTFPTFYKDFPVSVSPLTRRHRSKPGLTERWDLVAWGVELGTAYSELTDPIDQRQRLEEQSLLAAGGDPEAMELDEEFLRALEFGMPPTGGLGIGVDRIVMLITGSTIRQSLAFPLVKPERE
ncbi:bifunctional lysylphosphatidylglycerol synthetase/lysine--tRNA ligase LysX [Corynebacterium kroppenstedtii]|uniref:bifunctional lysylphosphatidylglycerol synthetase/lysine--tRNA ligase LysX n=1 Tax=Corynebacterium sp. PCR 32 TaxID=3351342 RepID=UPI0030967056